MELNNFLRMLRTCKKSLQVQQYKTLRGQAIAGDIDGARKGLQKILERRNKK